MDRYKEDIKRDIMFRLNLYSDFDHLNYVMMGLVNENRIQSYYISKNILCDGISIKHLLITSNDNKVYTITFNNLIKDYRDSVISFILK